MSTFACNEANRVISQVKAPVEKSFKDLKILATDMMNDSSALNLLKKRINDLPKNEMVPAMVKAKLFK